MSHSKYIVALIIVAAAAIPSLAKADNQRCELLSFKPTQVAPLYATVNAGRGGTTQHLSGAQVFIPAQPGLTPEWLRLDLERHVSAMNHQAMPGCPLANSGVSIAIVSGGNGFWVQIAAKDTNVANTVLQQAQLLVPVH
jgi:hypothetical protein